MQVDMKESGKLKKTMNINVSADTLADMRSKIVEQITKEANIPGFRKGKAPKDMIEKKHSSLIKDELLKEAVPHFYRLALEQNKEEPVSYPEFNDVSYDGEKISFKAVYEVKPIVKVDDKVYSKIKLKLSPLEVADKDIDQFISTLKKQLAGLLEKEEKDVDDAYIAHWSGYNDVQEFESAIRSELHLNKVTQRRRDIEKQILDALTDNVKFDLPEAVVDEQKQRLIYQQRQNLAQRGIPKEELQKHYDEIEKMAAKTAEDQVRMFYLLEAVADGQGIKHNQNNLLEAAIGSILTKIM